MDLGSSNRTYVNGMAVTEPTVLRSGDRISVGTTEMVLRVPGAPADETIASAETAIPAPVVGEPAVPAAAASAPVAAAPWSRPPRLAIVAGVFILLLCAATAIILYNVAIRTPADEATTSDEGAPVAVSDAGGGPVEGAEAAPANLVLTYEDDFEDSTSGWDDTSDAYTLKRYGNNRYQIEISASNLVAWGLANRDVSDFEIEVEAKLEDGAPDNSYGLLFRFQDRENFYRLDISGDGYFLLSKFVEGQWTTLVNWTEAENLHRGNASNTLKVSVFGPEITAWANGELLTSVEDESLDHGNFGFFASTFKEPYIWTSYDNLKLWVPQGQEQEIVLLPTATRPLVGPTDTPLPTSTLIPDLPTPVEPTLELVEGESDAAILPVSPISPVATPVTEAPAPPEPTATPVPLPEYASRDQTLGRSQTRVTGRIIFPVYDPERGTYDIYMADAADGGNRELIEENASQPALSPDGTLLAYRSWQPDNRGLITRPLNSDEAWVFNPFFESGRPQFSPVDNSLMYHSRVGGKEPAVYRVIDGVGEVMRREGFPIQGEAPKWLPNGQQFVYSSCLGGKCGIILSNIDGTNPLLLTDHPSDTDPEASPDGSQVVFMSKRGGNWEIYRVDVTGGNLVALTSDPADDGLPTWSPDGQKIAFVSNRDGEWSMWDADPDGGNQRRLFAIGGPVDGQVQHDLANSRGWVEENIDWAP